ncbi:hypothetical protein [Duganella qianjiadongensis]|uniref:Uncharacterized protein n=1 Tax=Duganella qianjiadongensis TaxID=2692176 RepID=A0ABW9VQQ1_9BURK|nr:hypothetical protein [Duganella qianjiadongensis]MYM41901.1 hypothetical protein [Duganella qianjiadongensis]
MDDAEVRLQIEGKDMREFKLFTHALLLVALMSNMSNAWASKEGLLVWSNFTIHSLGIGASGAVQISGSQSADGITSLKVNAFGREIALNAAQLYQLRGILMNGMQLSYADGTGRAADKTLSIVLTKGFASGVAQKKFIEIDGHGNVMIIEN